MRIDKPSLAIAALLVALAAAALLRHHNNHPHALQVGDRLVPLSFSSLSGDAVTVAPAGRPQIINVFATWCPPCRYETPQFAALAHDLIAHGISVIGVDQQESATAVTRFRDEFSLPYPVYIDDDNITHAVLGARMIPETVSVGSDGRIRWIREGPLDGDEIETIRRTLGAAV